MTFVLENLQMFCVRNKDLRTVLLFLNPWKFGLLTDSALQQINYQQMSTSSPMTLVALMNAMIGGTILVLPLLYLKAGWLPALVVTTITGIINYFSCKICFDHLLGDSDMPEAIYRHTKSRVYPKVYDVAVFLSVQLVLLLYFDLIVKQWDSILMVRSIVTAVVNAVVLFALVGMIKRFNLGVNVMGYGIASILGYLLFLIWLLASRPKGDQGFPVASWDFAELCDALATAFSLQGVFIPIIKKNCKPDKNPTLLLLAYIFGGAIYTFIGFAGGFGVLNRQAVDGETPETVEDFFGDREWPVTAIAAIYLIHLYSVFPQYLLISKQRFYSLFNKHESETMNVKDWLYIGIVILICFGVKISKISLETILALNGTFFGFFFIYMLPIGLHVKCVFFTRTIIASPSNPAIEMISLPKTVELQHNNDNVKYSRFDNQRQTKEIKGEELPQDSPPASTIEISCNIQATPGQKAIQISAMSIMLSFGLFVLGFSLYSLFTK